VRPKTRTFSFNTARNEVDRVCTHLFWPLVTELNVTVCVCVRVCVLVFKLTVVQQQWINGVLMLNDNSSTYHGISDTWPACKARTFDPTNSKPQQQLHKHHGSTLPFCYLPSKIQLFFLVQLSTWQMPACNHTCPFRYTMHSLASSKFKTVLPVLLRATSHDFQDFPVLMFKDMHSLCDILYHTIPHPDHVT